MNIIDDQNVIQIVKNMLNTIDHGERVTYLCLRIMEKLQASREDMLLTAKLALFHDIGAYKTDEMKCFTFKERKYGHMLFNLNFVHRNVNNI